MYQKSKEPILKGEYQLIAQENRVFNVEEIGRNYLRSKIKEELLSRHNVKEISENDLHDCIYSIKKYFYENQYHLITNLKYLDDFISKVLLIREQGYFISKFKILDNVNRSQFKLYTPDDKFLCIATQRNEIKISLPSLIPMFKDRFEKERYKNDWNSYLVENERTYEDIQKNYSYEFKTEKNVLKVQVYPIW